MRAPRIKHLSPTVARVWAHSLNALDEYLDDSANFGGFVG